VVGGGGGGGWGGWGWGGGDHPLTRRGKQMKNENGTMSGPRQGWEREEGLLRYLAPGIVLLIPRNEKVNRRKDLIKSENFN